MGLFVAFAIFLAFFIVGGRWFNIDDWKGRR